MTRAEVLEAIRATQSSAESRLVDGCADHFGEWSAKDLLCHLAAWQRIGGVKLRARREGREGTASEYLGRPLDGAESARLLALPLDETNAHLFELHRDLDWREANRLWRDSCELLLEEASLLTEADLEADPELAAKIGSDSFAHLREHLGG